MSRKDEIRSAYKYLGKGATFYDGMITCSTIPGKAVCKVVWNMGPEENTRYLELAMAGIPENFSGKMLEVPVGTGVLTMPVYKTLPRADITFLDYSSDMMAVAQHRAERIGLSNLVSQIQSQWEAILHHYCIWRQENKTILRVWWFWLLTLKIQR